LEDNLGASTGWTLSQNEIETLDRVSALPFNYPYEMIWRLNKDRERLSDCK